MPADRSSRLFPLALTALLAAGFAPLARAQGEIHVPDANAAQGPINLVPLGGKAQGAFQDMRAQIRVPASFLPSGGSTISDIGFAAGGAGDYSYAEIRVSLSHLAGAALGVKFAANLAGPVEVLRATSFRYRLPRAGEFHRLGCTASFTHDGTRDLVVDITIQGAFFSGDTPGSRRSDTLETVYALSYDLAQPVDSGYGPFVAGAKLLLVASGQAVRVYGHGCVGSNGKEPLLSVAAAPQLGKPWLLATTQANATSAALLLFGLSDKLLGPLPLPLELSAIGAPKCWLLNDVFLTVAAATNAAGAANVQLPIPNLAKLRGMPTFVQWMVADPSANTLGFAFSAGAATNVQ